MDGERRQLIDNVRIAIASYKSEPELLKAAIELIDEFSDGFSWSGFYMMNNGALEVGPYVGPETPHTRIELNAGICGAAASQKKSIIVDDVTSDPRFLACSPHTKSEIVVPLLDGEIVLGEIDIDSNQRRFFTKDDRKMFEKIALIIVARIVDLRKQSVKK
jgi:GAF domain-containing protein